MIKNFASKALDIAKLGLLRQLARCRTAAVAPMMALMIIPISGGIAFAVEQGSWYYFQRSMQNAADATAIAAASNNTVAGTAYLQEGRGVAAKLGFVDGTNNTTVQVGAPTPCPADATQTCYKATISVLYPLTFSRALGLVGDASSGNKATISASAVARVGGGTTGGAQQFPCFWAQSTAPSAFRGNGIPFANLTGCSVFSNGGFECNGHDTGADYAFSAISNNGNPPCARTAATTGETRDLPVNKYNVSMPPDPYAGAPYSTLAANAAASPCTTSPPTSGTTNLSLIVYCGNLTIAGNQTLTLNAPNTVVVIKGSLDLSANKSALVTSSAGSATIVFAGTAAPFGTGNIKGDLTITAPDKNSTSQWKGVAIYKAPTNPTTTATLAGSNPNWNVQGLVYMPSVDITIDGAVNKNTGAAACFMVVGNNILVNGNGSILNTTGGCANAGLPLPSITVGAGTLTTKLVL